VGVHKRNLEKELMRGRKAISIFVSYFGEKIAIELFFKI
jgi:hypothetical protein